MGQLCDFGECNSTAATATFELWMSQIYSRNGMNTGVWNRHCCNNATTQQCNHANNDITYVTAVNIGAPVTPNANAKTIVLIMPIATVIPNMI